MFKRTLVTLAAIALFGAGCAPATPTSNMPTANADVASAIQGNWKMDSFYPTGAISPTQVTDLGLTVSFDGTKMTGKVCNNMSGNYTVDTNGVLKAPLVISTKMFCEGSAGQAESNFEGSLTDGFKASITNDMLTLTSDKVVIHFVRP